MWSEQMKKCRRTINPINDKVGFINNTAFAWTNTRWKNEGIFVLLLVRHAEQLNLGPAMGLIGWRWATALRIRRLHYGNPFCQLCGYYSQKQKTCVTRGKYSNLVDLRYFGYCPFQTNNVWLYANNRKIKLTCSVIWQIQQAQSQWLNFYGASKSK